MVPASLNQRAHIVLRLAKLAQWSLLPGHFVWDFRGRAHPLPRELTIDQLNHAHREAVDINLFVVSADADATVSLQTDTSLLPHSIVSKDDESEWIGQGRCILVTDKNLRGHPQHRAATGHHGRLHHFLLHLLVSRQSCNHQAAG